MFLSLLMKTELQVKQLLWNDKRHVLKTNPGWQTQTSHVHYERLFLCSSETFRLQRFDTEGCSPTHIWQINAVQTLPLSVPCRPFTFCSQHAPLYTRVHIHVHTALLTVIIIYHNYTELFMHCMNLHDWLGFLHELSLCEVKHYAHRSKQDVFKSNKTCSRFRLYLSALLQLKLLVSKQKQANCLQADVMKRSNISEAGWFLSELHL